MAATPPAPDATAQPAPHQDRPLVSPVATPRVGRLLGLVRWIIGYGQELAASLQQGTAPARFSAIAFRFQTIDLAAILTRIRRGLMLAGMLETKLAGRAEAGRDVQPTPIRVPTPRTPRDPHAATEPKERPANIIDLPLDRLPSAEAIADELRRRPIGAVLVDICRDLCMQPGNIPAERWKELEHAVMDYGGNLVTLLFGCPLYDRSRAEARRIIAGGDPADAPEWVVPPLPEAAASLSGSFLDDTRKPVAA